MTTSTARRRRARVWSMAIAGLILSGGGVVAAGVAWRAAVKRAERAGARRRAEARGDCRGDTWRTHREAPPPTAPDVLPDPELRARAAAPAATLAAAAEDRARRSAPAPDLRPLTEPLSAPVADAPDEARLVARAFRHLRSEGDAVAALAALDERERQFGAGALGTEAALARAEALLLLGRTDDALPILVALRDPRTGLTPDVRVARAELLARARRCAEAVADFDALLAPSARACNARTGALRARVVPAAARTRGRRPGRPRPVPQGIPARTVRAGCSRGAGKIAAPVTFRPLPT